jgi:hypothetical protein
MYKVIGTDGKEYGPAEASLLREWIRQGRVEPQTPVFVAGSPEWTFVGLLPEFAHEFPGILPPVMATPSPAQSRPTLPLPSHPLAKAGLLCGVLSITVGCCCCGVPFNLLGLVFSVIALVQISENPQVSGGRDLAILGLILSLLSLVILGGFSVFH